jgi:hypothetical protein
MRPSGPAAGACIVSRNASLVKHAHYGNTRTQIHGERRD